MYTRKFILCLSWLLFLPLSSSLNEAKTQQLNNDPHQFIKALIASNSNLTQDRSVLEQLYLQQNIDSLWLDHGKPTDSTSTILNEIRHASSYGLRPTDYDLPKIESSLLTLSKLTGAAAAQLQAQLEITISTSVLRFIRHLHFGRITPRQVGFNLPESRNQELDLVRVLVNLAKSNQVAADLVQIEPQFSHYQLLKSALARYQALNQHPELTNLPKPIAMPVKIGDSYEGTVALRNLLIAEQDLANNEGTTNTQMVIDSELVEGLKKYQLRHGLTVDGVLGQKTFKQLTTPFSVRIQQIELTLERWRWLPPPQSPMIVVNIPQFKLFAFRSAKDNEATLLRLEVIVGQTFEHTQTPVFLAEMKYVVFRPYWDVPLNITKRELLPHIRRDPSYLTQHHFELVRGQGDTSPVVPATVDNINQLASGTIRLRQLPGDDNALGNIKFMLPNQYNVYLHSTPAQQLFSESRRAFSHGCVRVSNPLALAEYVLNNTSETWDLDRISAAMNGEANQRINLTRPIPVMIVYGTVMPLESGVVQFFDDLYGHDAKLAKLLY